MESGKILYLHIYEEHETNTNHHCIENLFYGYIFISNKTWQKNLLSLHKNNAAGWKKLFGKYKEVERIKDRKGMRKSKKNCGIVFVDELFERMLLDYYEFGR